VQRSRIGRLFGVGGLEVGDGGFGVMRQYRATGRVYWEVFFVTVGRATVLVLRVYGFFWWSLGVGGLGWCDGPKRCREVKGVVRGYSSSR
jgi:hypothetical protein